MMVMRRVRWLLCLTLVIGHCSLVGVTWARECGECDDVQLPQTSGEGDKILSSGELLRSRDVALNPVSGAELIVDAVFTGFELVTSPSAGAHARLAGVRRRMAKDPGDVIAAALIMAGGALLVYAGAWAMATARRARVPENSLKR